MGPLWSHLDPLFWKLWVHWIPTYYQLDGTLYTYIYIYIYVFETWFTRDLINNHTSNIYDNNRHSDNNEIDK